MLVGLMTCDTEVNHHRYKSARRVNQDCQFCEVEEEAVAHVPFDCEALSSTRRILGQDFIEESDTEDKST